MVRFILLAIGIISISSCTQRDDYTCTCKTVNMIVEQKAYVHVTEKTAKRKCDDLNASYQPAAGSQNLAATNCTLSK